MSEMLEPTAVLFACNHNAIRSPMAATLLRQLTGTRLYVDSVGVRPVGSPDGFAVAVLAEIGLDLADYDPKGFDDLEDGCFDLIITLSPQAHHRAMEMTRTMACDVEYWPSFDPSMTEGDRDTRLVVYRQLRDVLLKRLKTRFVRS